MSPEQAQGHDLDHRSDLYSLGVTFYHMLAGVPPFKADSPLALALKHVKDTPASIAVHRPDVPPELDRLVLKLMAKSPADRYQSAAEMLRDLARVREALHAPSTVQPVADVPGPSAAVEAAPSGAAAAAAAESRAGSRAETFRTRFLAADAAPPWLGRRAGAALVALGLAAGAAVGWANRPADLLSPSSAGAGAPSMPGLWMDPRWKAVERGLSAEDQYLYAQVRAPKEVQEAAWLAVPGHYPNSREWAARAYTQLARLLLVRHDVDRLRALAEEVDRWEGGQTHEKELAAIIRAGARALDRDLDGVLADFKERVRPVDLTDPALLGLSVDVIGQAERAASGADAGTNNVLSRNALNGIRQLLVNKLFQIRDPQFLRLRAG
jgi:serine/threonine-protein kinase